MPMKDTSRASFMRELDKRMASNRRVFDCDDSEYRLIVNGLRLLRAKLHKDLRQSQRKGFIPEPGHINLPEVFGNRLAVLMNRLGIDAKED